MLIKNIRYPLIFLFIIIFSISNPVFAHKILIENVEEGVVQVRYDDGTVAIEATVTAFDKEDNQLYQEQVDQDGYFHYEDLRVYRFIADDGMGHRTYFIIGEESNEVLIPVWIRATLGIGLLLFIGSFFISVIVRKQRMHKII